MSAWRMIFELLAIGLLILGIYYEDKIIIFEDNVKRIVKGNYKRFKRNLKKCLTK